MPLHEARTRTTYTHACSPQRFQLTISTNYQQTTGARILLPYKDGSCLHWECSTFFVMGYHSNVYSMFTSPLNKSAYPPFCRSAGSTLNSAAESESGEEVCGGQANDIPKGSSIVSFVSVFQEVPSACIPLCEPVIPRQTECVPTSSLDICRAKIKEKNEEKSKAEEIVRNV